MNEQDFAHKITRTLNQGLTSIGDDKLAKLRQAREKAIANFREPVAVENLVTTTGQTVNAPSIYSKPLFWLPILAIVVALLVFNNAGDDEIYDPVGELDVQLLTGELPIDAFLDKDFGSWVKDSSN